MSTEDFSSDSFVKIGSSLEMATPPLTNDARMEDKAEDVTTPKSEQSSPICTLSDAVVDQPLPSDNNTSTGILIMEAQSVPQSVSEISVNTFDVDAADEILSLLSKEEIATSRNYSKNRIIPAAVYIFSLALLCILYQSKSEANAKEHMLLAQIDELKSELSQIDELKAELSLLRFNQEMDNCKSKHGATLLEIDNCYFNFEASASLGSCAESFTRSAQDLYEWSVSGMNNVLEETFSDDSADTDKGAEIDDDLTDMNELLDDLYDWGIKAGDVLVSGINSFLEVNLSGDDAEIYDVETWAFDL